MLILFFEGGFFLVVTWCLLSHFVDAFISSVRGRLVVAELQVLVGTESNSNLTEQLCGVSGLLVVWEPRRKELFQNDSQKGQK